MTILVWDEVGSRFYEKGVSHGVFYSPNHLVEVEDVFYPKGFPWNGLTAVDVNPENLSVTPLYFDGVKILDMVSLGDFSAGLRAITYPDEFIEFDGLSEAAPGMYVDNQERNTFGLSYKSIKGNDLQGNDLGYKLHVLYNLTAIPDSIGYQTVSSNVDPIEFSWTLTSKPEKIPGHRPSAHFIFDSTKVNEEALAEIEAILYGTVDTEPRLPTVSEILSYMTVTITDNGDGTWTAEGPSYYLGLIDPITFQIQGANVEYIDEDTYEISSTYI